MSLTCPPSFLDVSELRTRKPSWARPKHAGRMTNCLTALFCTVESSTCLGHTPKGSVKLFSLLKHTLMLINLHMYVSLHGDCMVIAKRAVTLPLHRNLLHNIPSSPVLQHTRQSCSHAEHKTLVNSTTWGPLLFTFQNPLRWQRRWPLLSKQSFQTGSPREMLPVSNRRAVNVCW